MSARIDPEAELMALVEILPPALQAAVRALPGEELLEIVLDLGRPPEARLVQRTEYLAEAPVTEAELEAVLTRLSPLAEDNRAGIERTLHRVSAIRNRRGRVVGLTLRVGRAIVGTIELIKDLVESGRNLLLLGRPGVGKTTKLREIARVLADDLDKRVMVIDTSNEIGGDGDIPHPAIGRARRMQVSRPELQHAVMIEAVENHMPEAIIVDEIGTAQEALAARTIAERGVQLVATAHGNTLDNLVLNPTLSDLVGGVHQVTLSDEEARRRGTLKTVSERRAPPTFDVVVELVNRDEVVVHRDTAHAVDALLAGRNVGGERRTREGAEVGAARGAARSERVAGLRAETELVVRRGVVSTGAEGAAPGGAARSLRDAEVPTGEEGAATRGAARSHRDTEVRTVSAARGTVRSVRDAEHPTDAEESAAPRGAARSVRDAEHPTDAEGSAALRGAARSAREAELRRSAGRPADYVTDELAETGATRAGYLDRRDTTRGVPERPVATDELHRRRGSSSAESAEPELTPHGWVHGARRTAAVAPSRGAARFASNAPESEGAGTRATRVYIHGVGRQTIDRVMRTLGADIRIVARPENAEVVFVLRSRAGDPRIRRLLERGSGVQSVMLKRASASELRRALRNAFVVGANAAEEEELRDALEEAELAVNRALAESVAIPLAPRSPPVRKLQHQLAERFHLQTVSVGSGKERHLVIYPEGVDERPGADAD